MRSIRHRATSGRPNAARLLALLLLSGIFSGAALPTITIAQTAMIERTATDPYSAHVAEAAQRFRIPERWIRAVMRVESAGRVRAVSSAGAMGLMQIMPDTWAGLRLRHRLGRDPFDPRANILGGTAYLREMYDRFGSPGFLAAYNAGPARYQQHLDSGRPLPRETRRYMATLLPMIGLAPPNRAATVVSPPPDWREAPLFVERSNGSAAANPGQKKRQVPSNLPTSPKRDESAEDARSDAVFVAQSRTDKSP